MSLAFLCRFNCGHGKLCHRLNVQTSSNCLTDMLTSHMGHVTAWLILEKQLMRLFAKKLLANHFYKQDSTPKRILEHKQHSYW